VGHRPVDGEPAVQPRIGGVPGHGRVVGVAGGHDPARRAHPQHLAQRRDGVAEVLEQLVGVHDVEGAVRVVEGVGVADGERHVLRADGRRVRPGVDQRAGGGLDADDGAGCDPRGEVGGDRAGPAADVEHARARPQVGDQVGGRAGHRPAGVRAEHAGGVPVRVGLQSARMARWSG
jgi:hypothetical protein